MERIAVNLISLMSCSAMVLSGFLAGAITWVIISVWAPAFAGTVLAPHEVVRAGAPIEVYPESRFGRLPANVGPGISKGYARAAVEDLENTDDEGALSHGAQDATNWRGSRSPAGLDFSNPRNSQAAESALKLTTPADPMPSAISAIVRKGVQEVALIAGDLGFFPKTVFVNRDIPVRLFVTGASKNTLCIMMDSFKVRKQIKSQKIEEITFTPTDPGKYRFYCPVNGTEGTLIVRELTSAGASVGSGGE